MLINRNGLLTLWCTVILCMAPGSAHGDSQLTSRVEQLAQSLKKQPPQVAVLDFVDWERSFKEMDAERRQSSGIASPEALRSRIRRLVDDPVASFERQFERIATGYDPVRRQLFSEAFAARTAEIRATWKRTQSELTNASYAVNSIKIDPLDKGLAHVSLSSSTASSLDPLTFTFEKHGEQWFVVTDISEVAIEGL